VSSGIEGIEYTVRRSDRARRIRVTVDAAGQVEVVIPRRTSLREADAAARHFRPWIERQLAKHAVRSQTLEARGDTLPYLGETLTLVGEPDRSRVHRRGEALLVPAAHAGQRALFSDEPLLASPGTREAVERWYRRMAREEITPILDAACEELGVSYTKLTIRGQKTRWGSCSRSGALSFNWRLLLAPREVLEYVIWHEVCHLLVMDHSPRFWALVKRQCPAYRDHTRWLREHGTLLVVWQTNHEQP
jgi:predicted metal-dependent hydrolase